MITLDHSFHLRSVANHNSHFWPLCTGHCARVSRKMKKMTKMAYFLATVHTEGVVWLRNRSQTAGLITFQHIPVFNRPKTPYLTQKQPKRPKIVWPYVALSCVLEGRKKHFFRPKLTFPKMTQDHFAVHPGCFRVRKREFCVFLRPPKLQNCLEDAVLVPK